MITWSYRYTQFVFNAHRIHGIGRYHECLIFMLNVGPYMDPMGYVSSGLEAPPNSWFCLAYFQGRTVSLKKCNS